MAYDIFEALKAAELSAGHIESTENLDSTINEQIVIATWGFGPTYRDRVKYNIQEAYSSGYTKLMKFVILTDYVEDFSNMAPELKNLIVGVHDINELRKDDTFSFEFEPIPVNVTNDEEYAKEWRELCDKNFKLMSYSLKRYLLKAIYETTNYTKILMIDSDVELPYNRLVSGQLDEKQFWAHLHTPVNTLRGCGYEEFNLINIPPENRLELIWSKSVGYADSKKAIQSMSIVMYNYYKQHNRLNEFFIRNNFPIVEGPLRFFNFSDRNKLIQFFNTLNDVTKLFLEHPQLYSTNRCGGYILCDYLPLSLALIIDDVKSFHFSGRMYHFRTFHEDRFFGPSWFEYHDCNGKNLHLKQAKNRKEFLEINEEIIECMKKTNQWPSISWSCF